MCGGTYILVKGYFVPTRSQTVKKLGEYKIKFITKKISARLFMRI